MKFTSLAILASCTSTLAFAPSQIKSQASTTSLSAHNNVFKSIEENVKGAVAATFLAGAIWALPAALVGGDVYSSNPFLNEVRSSVVADAKEMASGSGSRVNKDPESLLRLALPIPKDKEVSHANMITRFMLLGLGSLIRECQFSYLLAYRYILCFIHRLTINFL